MFSFLNLLLSWVIPGLFFVLDIEDLSILLKQKSNAPYLAGMRRFRIDNTKALGIPIPELRKLARVIKKDHGLALQIGKPVFTKCGSLFR